MANALLGDRPVGLVNRGSARALGVLRGLRRRGCRSRKGVTVAGTGRGRGRLIPLLPLGIGKGRWVAHVGVPHWGPPGVPGPGGPLWVGREAARSWEGGGLMWRPARRALLSGSLLREDLRCARDRLLGGGLAFGACCLGGGLEAGAAGVERLKVCLGGEARSAGDVDDLRAFGAGEPPVKAAALFAFHIRPAARVEALATFGDVVPGWWFAARKRLGGTLLLLLGLDRAILAPVHGATCVARPRRRVVRLPPFARMSSLVDVFSVRGIRLGRRKKGVVDRAANAEEVCGEGGLPRGQEVRVDCAKHVHCRRVRLELPCWGESSAVSIAAGPRAAVRGSAAGAGGECAIRAWETAAATCVARVRWRS